MANVLQTINIKNIKISPLSLEKEEPGMKICIECDHNLTREQKIQIEKLTKLGKIKVNLKATIEKVIKDEGKHD